MVKTEFHGKSLPNSTTFSDRSLLPLLYDLQIIKMKIFFDQNLKHIKGFQAFYYCKTTQNIIEGGKNVLLKEDPDKIEIKEFICNPNDFIKLIAGSMSEAEILESLTLTTNMDAVYKVGEESLNSFHFKLNIETNEIPICLYGEYSNFFGINLIIIIIKQFF